MKKMIGKREYDTDTATVVKKKTFGNFGDPAGYEEILFHTPDGLYFVYGNGGEKSPHPNENIQRLAKSKVNAWVETH